MITATGPARNVHQTQRVSQTAGVSLVRFLGLASLFASVHSQLFPAAIELSSLNGTAGFRLFGENAGDECGFTVSGIGDVNDDGIDDFLIGANLAGPVGRDAAGRSYVVFGKKGLGAGGIVELSSLNGTNGFVINGEKMGDHSSRSASGAGDVNADGIDDILIGALDADPGGRSNAGKTYVVFGKAGLGASGTLELSGLSSTSGLVLNGEKDGDTSGRTLSSGGDINKDGIDDFLIGARRADPTPLRNGAGKVYAVFGRKDLGGTLELSALNGTNGFIIHGENQGDGCGRSLSAGDVNGDGIDDILIGAYKAGAGAGKAYVIYGKPGLGASGVLELSQLSGINGFMLVGKRAGDETGSSVSCGGDINVDGFGDFLVGAQYPGTGRAFVVFGHPSRSRSGPIPLADLNGTDGFIFRGEKGGDSTGFSSKIIPDFNGDGVADLLIGAHGADPDTMRVNAGKSYIIFGRRGLNDVVAADLDGSRGFVVKGEQGGDQSGRDVNDAGDVNGDGIADVLIAARFADPSPTRANAGKIYVLFGRELPARTTALMPMPVSQSAFLPSSRTILAETTLVVPTSHTPDQVATTLMTTMQDTSGPALTMSSTLPPRTTPSVTAIAKTSLETDKTTLETEKTSLGIGNPSLSWSPARSAESSQEISLALPLAIAGGVCAVVSSVVGALLALRCRRKATSARKSEGNVQGAGESSEYASVRLTRMSLEAPTPYESGEILSKSQPCYIELPLGPEETVYSTMLMDSADR